MSVTNFARLRHRVTIEAAEQAPDGCGGFVETWSALAEVWAMIRPSNGAERIDADRFAGRVTHEIVLRHREGVGPGQRIRYGSRLFDIRAAFDIDERGRWLRCVAEERLL